MSMRCLGAGPNGRVRRRPPPFRKVLSTRVTRGEDRENAEGDREERRRNRTRCREDLDLQWHGVGQPADMAGDDRDGAEFPIARALHSNTP